MNNSLRSGAKVLYFVGGLSSLNDLRRAGCAARCGSGGPLQIFVNAIAETLLLPAKTQRFMEFVGGAA